MTTTDWLGEMKRNWDALVRDDERAKAEGKLVGRYVDHPYADGHAVYQIVKESARTVRIEVVTGIGDDWVLPAWGRAATISRKLAEELIGRRDALDALFAKKRA